MWGNPTLFHRTKSVAKNIEKREKINIDTISCEKLFDRSVTTSNAIYRVYIVHI